MKKLESLKLNKFKEYELNTDAVGKVIGGIYYTIVLGSKLSDGSTACDRFDNASHGDTLSGSGWPAKDRSACLYTTEPVVTATVDESFT